jgi:hypothetical protein
MSAKKPATDQKKAAAININDPDDSKGTLKSMGGSKSDN